MRVPPTHGSLGKMIQHCAKSHLPETGVSRDGGLFGKGIQCLVKVGRKWNIRKAVNTGLFQGYIIWPDIAFFEYEYIYTFFISNLLRNLMMGPAIPKEEQTAYIMLSQELLDKVFKILKLSGKRHGIIRIKKLITAIKIYLMDTHASFTQISTELPKKIPAGPLQKKDIFTIFHIIKYHVLNHPLKKSFAFKACRLR